MTKDKQIEELSNGIWKHCNAGLFKDEAEEIALFVIERQGYRKASDVAREIIDLAKGLFCPMCDYDGYEIKKALEEIAKKCTEGE